MQASKCLELRIDAGQIDEERFELLCESLEATGSAEETDIDSNLCERIGWFSFEDNETELRLRISAGLTEAGFAAGDYQLNTLAASDWETAWQENWHGLPIGESLWVRPSFRDAPEDDRIDIVLDPGMAFGTGTHPTTQLCLEAIERVCKENPPATLLDMGAGSGLLAIAAMKLGTGQALAIDMEEDSVEACNVNAGINGVEIEAKVDDTPPTEQFDLVVANILAAPLVWMARELAACVSDRLILSGLLVEQVDDVAAAYVKEGLTEVRRDAMGEWASVELIRS